MRWKIAPDMRPGFPYLALVILFLYGAACHQIDQEEKRTPNVLLILADDLGAGDLGFAGSRFYETPSLDRLAGSSAVFINGYSASRVCSPSRASIMTGQFTARHGITDWIGAYTGEEWRKMERHDKLLPAPYESRLSGASVTLAEAMKASGYLTFFAGKWHLGGRGSYPEDHGFDLNAGGWEKGSPIGGYFSPWENPKLPNREAGENLSVRLARETIKFIEASRDTSFFAMLSFYAVHAPLQTTKEKWAKYRDKAEQSGIPDNGFIMERVLPSRVVQDNPVYAGLVETMDDAIGMVLDELEKQGLADNTIVIFTSDNGGVTSGDAYATSNLPLRGGKGYQWEGGLRVPFLVHVPWMGLDGRTISVPVTGADIYPTIMDLTGNEPEETREMDGISLKVLLQGDSLPSRPLFWHYPHYGNQGGEPSSVIRSGKWKLIHYWEDGRDELYNLEMDPAEQQDRAGDFPELRAGLRGQLQTWLGKVQAKVPKPDPQYDPEKAFQRRSRIRNELLPAVEARRREYLSPAFMPNADWWGSVPAPDSLQMH